MNPLELTLAGLTMGIVGSLHCIGMCGPIALGLSGNQGNKKDRLGSIFLYNTGRAASYSLMGLILGLIGNRFAFSGYQQVLSIAAGILILFIFSTHYFPIKKITWLHSWNATIQKLLSEVLNRPRTRWYHLEIGVINAWLPCGLVYLALASALASANAWHGALFMFMFGLGTMPLMASLMIAGNYFSYSLRASITRFIPVFVLLTATLLILRGMNLGIPYISPLVDVAHNCVSKCCHR